MDRSNTRLSWDLLKNERSRRVTFRKRKTGLLKKAYELNTLCDVKGCVIINERNFDGQFLPSEIYPEPEEVKQIIKRYASCSSKKDYNLDDFYAEKTIELQKETKKLRQQNDEARFPARDDGIDALLLDELRSLAQNLDHKIEAAAARRRSMLCATHEGLPRPMPLPLYPYVSSSDSDMMYDNGRDLPEEHCYAQGLYNNLDHQMLPFQQQSSNDWTCSNEYAPSTSKVTFNNGMQYGSLEENNVTFHNLAPAYPMSMSALFPPHLVSPQKLPLIKSRSRCLAMQPSLENINIVSSSQSHEDLRRLESNIRTFP